MKKILIIFSLLLSLIFIGCTPITKYKIDLEHKNGKILFADVEVTSYSAGAYVEVTAVPDDGYKFIHWKIDDEIKSEEITYAFKMPSKAIVLTAVFEANNLEVVSNVLNIFTLNDLHGTVDGSDANGSFARIAEYLKQNKGFDSIVIGAGDMFQGTALSSMTRGKAMVEMMNVAGFDAMSVGNHEFDWGIDEILPYFNGQSDVQANFPLLVSNVIDKTTGELASWANPYTVIEKNGLKIGVLGVIGSNQETDILTSYVKNYDFTDELTAIKKYTKILRTDEKCDVVVLSLHFDSSFINDQLVNLSDEYKVDAIVNGHTHQYYYGEISRNDGTVVPYIQTGSYGRYIGKITLEFNPETKKIIDGSADCISTLDIPNTESTEILDIFQKYIDYVNVANEVLGTSGEYIDQNQGANVVAKMLALKFDAEIGIMNSGGIRGNGFPIEKDEIIDYGDVFEITPFENKVVIFEIPGRILEQAYNTSGLVIYNNVGNSIDYNKTYTVATVDFVYERLSYPFHTIEEHTNTERIMRDVFAEYIQEVCVKNNGLFYVNPPIIVDSELTINEIITRQPGIYNTKGTVVAVNAQSFVLQDETGLILVYNGEEWTVDVQVGDILKLKGMTSVYGYAIQFTKGSTYEFIGKTDVKNPIAEELIGYRLDEYMIMNPITIKYAKVVGTLTVSGKYFNIIFDEAFVMGSISYPIDVDKVSALDGKKIEVEGYITGFTGGKYVNLVATSIEEFKETPEPPVTGEVKTIAEILVAESGEYQASGLVVGVNAQSFVLKDETGLILVYNGTEWATEIKVGDVVTVTGTTSVYGNAVQFAKGSTYEVIGNEEVINPDAKELTIAELDAYAILNPITIQYGKIIGTLSVSNGKYFNVNIDGAIVIGSISYPIDVDSIKALEGKKIEVEGYITGFTGGSYVNLVATSVKEIE